MVRRKRVLLLAAVAALALEQIWLLAPVAKRLAFPPQEDPAEAGRRVAERLGCFGCHGAEGNGGIKNPGSEEGSVPSLSGGTMMMWADDEEELREWILYGGPLDEKEHDDTGAARADHAGEAAHESGEQAAENEHGVDTSAQGRDANGSEHEHGDKVARNAHGAEAGEHEHVAQAAADGRAANGDGHEHVSEAAEHHHEHHHEHGHGKESYDAGGGGEQALAMPAFESQLRVGELDLLVAYLKSISGLQFPEDEQVARGLDLAYDLGCFRCHGPMGTGGLSNPGSLKGYVPGFFGEDFAEVIESSEEAEQWIRNGISDRFRKNILARNIIERQAVKMPAYGKYLKDDDIEALEALVRWLNDGAWRTIPVP